MSQIQTLSDAARKVITHYLRLPLGKEHISCPYYNNARAGVRAGLRVLIGKGSPEDIVEEARLIAQRERIDLEELSKEDLTKFLVHHTLGVDCSGLAYHVLHAEMQSRGKGALQRALTFDVKNPVRRMLTTMRPAESTNVQVLASDINSVEIEREDLAPGDMIVMLDIPGAAVRDHVLIVEEIEEDHGIVTIIRYVHSLAWSSDGAYQHGVRRGEIHIVNTDAPLLEQRWIEQGQSGDKNETFKRAKKATRLELRRLRAFLS